MRYVRRAGELKGHRLAVHDEAREKEILQAVASQARAQHDDPEVAVAVFRALLKQSNRVERNVVKTRHTE